MRGVYTGQNSGWLNPLLLDARHKEGHRLVDLTGAARCIAETKKTRESPRSDVRRDDLSRTTGPVNEMPRCETTGRGGSRLRPLLRRLTEGSARINFNHAKRS